MIFCRHVITELYTGCIYRCSSEAWSVSTHKMGNYIQAVYIDVPARLGQFQPTKWAIRLFYLYSGGGLPAFHCFHCLSSQILVVVWGGLQWFVVVCSGLWWFAVVCLIVMYPAHY